MERIDRLHAQPRARHRHQRRQIAAALALVLPGAALADCPGPGDLARGIVVDTMRGEEHFAWGEGGTVTGTLRPEGQDHVEVTTYAGGFFPLSTTVTPDSGAGYTASFDLDRAAFDALLPLEVGDSLGLPVRYSRDNPQTAVDMALTVTVRGDYPVVIGDCDYTALQVQYELERPDGTFRTMMNYLPDLGFAYVVGRVLPNEDDQTRDARSIRIEGE